MNQPERLKFIYVGGPYPQECLVTTVKYPWPPPEFVKAAGYEKGVYRKTFASQGEAKPGETLRGAMYEWRPDEVGYEIQEDK